MDDESMYLILRYLDEPKRILGLTMDDYLIGGFTIFLVIVGSSKIVMALVGIGIRIGIRKILKGKPPSHLLSLMYWYFPHVITNIFIKNLPPSYKRYWTS